MAMSAAVTEKNRRIDGQFYNDPGFGHEVA